MAGSEDALEEFESGARYFIQDGGDEQPWVEVDLDGWISAERGCGFLPKGGGHRPATAGFSSYQPGHGRADRQICGKITYDGSAP